MDVTVFYSVKHTAEEMRKHDNDKIIKTVYAEIFTSLPHSFAF